MASSSAGLQPIHQAEGISEYRLENGLKLLLIPDPTQPTITVNLTVLVGARHEGYGETGLAHLLEHMTFSSGTPSFGNIRKVLQQRGARRNGTTSYDRTNYYETLPATDENLQFAIQLEAERLVACQIQEEDWASELSVVRNELDRSETQPLHVLNRRLRAAAFQWHNYGKSVIGNVSDIENVPLARLEAFYRKWYRPDNCVLIVAGRFEPESCLRFVQTYFGPVARPLLALEATYTEEPPQDGERQIWLRRAGDLAAVEVAYHVPAVVHPDFAVLEVLTYLLRMPPAGRLYRALVETGRAASAFASLSPRHDPDLLVAGATFRDPESLEVVHKQLLEELEGGSRSVDPQEVHRAQEQFLKHRELLSKDSSRLAIELSNWAALGDWRLMFLHRDRVEQVTAEQVREVAARYLRASNRTVALFEPRPANDQVTIPSASALQQLLESFRARPATAVGEAFDVSPRAIESQTQRLFTAVGLKAALLPKRSRGQSVYLRLTLRYGSEKTLTERQQAAIYLLPSLMARGTTTLSFQELQDRLDQHRAILQTGSDSRRGEALFALQTTREHLLPSLELLADVLRRPRLEDHELDVLRRQRQAALDAQRNDPEHRAALRLAQQIAPYPPGDVRRIQSTEERIEQLAVLNLEEIRTLYDAYLGAAAGELVVVGDFDPAAVADWTNRLVEDWVPKTPVERIRIPAIPSQPGSREVLAIPERPNAAYRAGLVLPLSDSDPDYPALLLGNYLFGGSSASRLFDRIREQEGLSYGVGAYLAAAPLDARADLVLYATVSPAKLARLEELAHEELQRLLQDEIPEEELNRARAALLNQQSVLRTEDSRLAAQLSETLFAERTMDYFQQLEEQIAGLRPDEVSAALRRHVQPDQLTTVVAGDFST